MPVMQSPPGAYALIDGRCYLYFAGTGYLGLQSRAEVIGAACEAVAKYGIGSATSRLRTGFGDTPPVLEVERLAAEFFDLADAFYFASGYFGATILATVFREEFDAVFVDELSHYSIFDAARLADRPVFTFRHRNAADLREHLGGDLPPGGRPLVLTDGVFAVSGKIAPATEYYGVLKEFPGAILAVDDAHALGVLGGRGRGTFEDARLWDAGVNCHPAAEDADGPRLLLCGTCSKAIGGYGGIIPGSRAFIDRLKTTSHLYSGASPPPIPTAAATAKAIELILDEPGLRRQLQQNVSLLREGLRGLGFDIEESPVPIVSLTIGDAANMVRIQHDLALRGICITYFAAYSGVGPEGALRIAVFATHTPEMIGMLLDALKPLV